MMNQSLGTCPNFGVHFSIGTADHVVTEFEHNAFGEVSWVQVNSDYSTTLVRDYDAAGNLILDDDPDAGTKSYEYDALGNVVGTADANGNTSVLTYDARNRLISRTDNGPTADAEIAEWFYDFSEECDAAGRFIGNLCLKRQPSGYEESYQYDSLGRLETTTTLLPGTVFTDGLSFARVHDEFGREAARLYPNGFAAYFSYNDYGYLRTIEDQDGVALKTVLSRDASGNEISSLLGNGVEINKTYSKALETLASMSVVGIQNETYTWFGNGSLFKKTANGIDVTYSYDPLNRLSSLSSVDAQSGDTLQSDFDYDPLGNLVSKPGVVEALYEDAERPHAVTTVKSGRPAEIPEPEPQHIYTQGIPCPAGGTYVGSRCEFEAGQLAASDHTYVSDATCPFVLRKHGDQCYEAVSFVCSKYGRVSTGGFMSPARCGTTRSWPTFYYGPGPDSYSCPSDLPSRNESYNMYSGSTVTCYDLTNRYAVCPSGSFQVPGKPKGTCYKNEPAQAVTVTEKCVAPGQSASTAHDPDTVVQGGTCWYAVNDVEPYCPTDYLVSDGKSLVSDWADADACYKIELVTPELGEPEIDNIYTYDYDNNGNVIQRGDYAIEYTTFNKPKAIGGPLGETVFEYGPDRSRYLQISAARDIAYVGEGLYEVVDEGGSTREISYVGDFLQVVNEGSSESYQYLHRDHLGSIVAITDDSGAVVSNTSYEPFGSRSGDTNFSHRGFTDHEHLAVADLIHMNGRLYDASIGRFTTPDIAVQNSYGSQNYNRYSYVLNNPTSLVDPTGYLFQEIAEGISDIFVSWGLTSYQPIDYVDLTPSDNYFVNEGASILGGFQNIVTWGANSGLAGLEAVSWSLPYSVSAITGDTLEQSDQHILAASAAFPVTFGAYQGLRLTRASRYMSVTGGAGQKPIIVGENMKRVQEYADKIGGHAYRPWKNDPFDFDLGMRRNEGWIKDQMRNGREVIDIGPDFQRRAATGRSSLFYEMERRNLNGYENYNQAFDRKGSNGGVPGLDF